MVLGQPAVACQGGGDHPGSCSMPRWPFLYSLVNGKFVWQGRNGSIPLDDKEGMWVLKLFFALESRQKISQTSQRLCHPWGGTRVVLPLVHNLAPFVLSLLGCRLLILASPFFVSFVTPPLSQYAFAICVYLHPNLG